MASEKNQSNQFGSPLACKPEHAKVIDCVEQTREKDFTLMHLWCVSELDDLSHCVHSQRAEEEYRKVLREPQPVTPTRHRSRDVMDDVMLATKRGVNEASQKTIQIPITEGPTNVAPQSKTGNALTAPRLISSFQLEESSVRRTTYPDDSEARMSRRPIFNVPPPPPLYRGMSSEVVPDQNPATKESNSSTLDSKHPDNKGPQDLLEQPARGFRRFLPWMANSDDTELQDMMKAALSEVKSVATALSKAIPELQLDRSPREDKEPSERDYSLFMWKKNQDQEDARSAWNWDRKIRSPFCPLYWFQSDDKHENDASGFEQGDQSPSLLAPYHRERDHARSAHYHQDSRKDRLPIYRSKWIDDEKQQESNKDASTRAWVDQMLGTCNAMSQGKSEQDRLNRFALAYERIQANDPMNQETARNTFYHGNVGMLQAFQFCLALENLGKQLPTTTSTGTGK